MNEAQPIYAEVSLINGLVTNDSEVTVEGTTVPLLQRSERNWVIAPTRITETLTGMGYRTVKIMPTTASVVRVLVERDSAS